MKFPFLPRPSREELATQPVHVVVRDYPETLADFQAHGLRPEEWGHHSLDELDDAWDLLDDLEAATAWRPRPGRA